MNSLLLVFIFNHLKRTRKRAVGADRIDESAFNSDIFEEQSKAEVVGSTPTRSIFINLVEYGIILTLF